MEQVIREYLQLFGDLSFRRFQNALSQKMYNTLAQGYTASDNEVALVGKLADAINNSTFRKLKFYGHKIHGSRSYVEFFYRDKPITKEIADMVIISIASHKRQRVLQKIAFVQNKVDRNNKWVIDDEQLYLLKNFPTFSGKRGIFRTFSNEDIVFLNNSKCLGLFGLFADPGEMILLSAPLLSEIKEDNRITREEIRLPETVPNVGTRGFLFPVMIDHRLLEEFIHYMYRHMPIDAFFIPFMANGFFPFLNNSSFSRDIHDFTRDWTQFNIGELTYAFGNVLNPVLDKFAIFLLRTIGIQDYVDLPLEGVEGEFSGKMALLVMHMDLAKEKEEK